MIRISPAAEAQVDQLITHYEAKGRLCAAENLLHALERAKERISIEPQTGLHAPRSLIAVRLARLLNLRIASER